MHQSLPAPPCIVTNYQLHSISTTSTISSSATSKSRERGVGRWTSEHHKNNINKHQQNINKKEVNNAVINAPSINTIATIAAVVAATVTSDETACIPSMNSNDNRKRIIMY